MKKIKFDNHFTTIVLDPKKNLKDDHDAERIA